VIAGSSFFAGGVGIGDGAGESDPPDGGGTEIAAGAFPLDGAHPIVNIIELMHSHIFGFITSFLHFERGLSEREFAMCNEYAE